jgi:hypothetical protein
MSMKLAGLSTYKNHVMMASRFICLDWKLIKAEVRVVKACIEVSS